MSTPSLGAMAYLNGQPVIWDGAKWIPMANGAGLQAGPGYPLQTGQAATGLKCDNDITSGPAGMPYSAASTRGAILALPNTKIQLSVPRTKAFLAKEWAFSMLLKGIGLQFAVMDAKGNFSVQVNPESEQFAPADAADMDQFTPVLLDISGSSAYVRRCGQLYELATDGSENLVTHPIGLIQNVYVDTSDPTNAILFVVPAVPPKSVFEQVMGSEGTAVTLPPTGVSPAVFGLSYGIPGTPIILLSSAETVIETGQTSVTTVYVGGDFSQGAGAGYLLTVGDVVSAAPGESKAGTHVFQDGTDATAGRLGPTQWSNAPVGVASAGGAAIVVLYAQVLNGLNQPLTGQTVQWTLASAGTSGLTLDAPVTQQTGTNPVGTPTGINVSIVHAGGEGAVISQATGNDGHLSGVAAAGTMFFQCTVNGRAYGQVNCTFTS